jgi:hypothetical protein
MRFMVLVKASPASEGAKPGPHSEPAGPSDHEALKKAFAEMGRFNFELANAGMLLGMDGLKPSSTGARISFSGKERVVTDGPFTETKELIAGFWMIQANSKEDAIAWMSRVPFEEGQIEIRQVGEASDLPADVSDPKRRAELYALIDRANAERKAS